MSRLDSGRPDREILLGVQLHTNSSFRGVPVHRTVPFVAMTVRFRGARAEVSRHKQTTEFVQLRVHNQTDRFVREEGHAVSSQLHKHALFEHSDFQIVPVTVTAQLNFL